MKNESQMVTWYLKGYKASLAQTEGLPFVPCPYPASAEQRQGEPLLTQMSISVDLTVSTSSVLY